MHLWVAGLLLAAHCSFIEAGDNKNNKPPTITPAPTPSPNQCSKDAINDFKALQSTIQLFLTAALKKLDDRLEKLSALKPNQILVTFTAVRSLAPPHCDDFNLRNDIFLKVVPNLFIDLDKLFGGIFDDFGRQNYDRDAFRCDIDKLLAYVVDRYLSINKIINLLDWYITPGIAKNDTQTPDLVNQCKAYLTNVLGPQLCDFITKYSLSGTLNFLTPPCVQKSVKQNTISQGAPSAKAQPKTAAIKTSNSNNVKQIGNKNAKSQFVNKNAKSQFTNKNAYNPRFKRTANNNVLLQRHANNNVRVKRNGKNQFANNPRVKRTANNNYFLSEMQTM